MPYFRAELIEKTEHDDRLQIIKASIAKLKVIHTPKIEQNIVVKFLTVLCSKSISIIPSVPNLDSHFSF